MSENKNLVPLTKAMIDYYFDNKEDQSDVFIALYSHCYPVPVWEAIDTLDSYPTCNKVTGEYIFQKFIEFDKKYHPGVLPGGLWMNSGFSVLNAEDIPEWTVIPCGYTLKNN